MVVLERADGAWPGVTATVVGEHAGRPLVDLGVGLAQELEPELEVVVSTLGSDRVRRVRAHARKVGTLVELAAQGDAVPLGRRRLSRRSIELPVCLANLDGDDAVLTTVRGRTLDLGADGTRVLVDGPFPAGCDPTVHLTLPGGERVVALAAVVGSSPTAEGTEYSLVFEGLGDDTRELLGRLAGAWRAA